MIGIVHNPLTKIACLIKNNHRTIKSKQFWRFFLTGLTGLTGMGGQQRLLPPLNPRPLGGWKTRWMVTAGGCRQTVVSSGSMVSRRVLSTMHARMPTPTKNVETACRSSVMGLIIRCFASSCVVLVAAYMVFTSVWSWFLDLNELFGVCQYKYRRPALLDALQEIVSFE